MHAYRVLSRLSTQRPKLCHIWSSGSRNCFFQISMLGFSPFEEGGGLPTTAEIIGQSDLATAIDIQLLWPIMLNARYFSSLRPLVLPEGGLNKIIFGRGFSRFRLYVQNFGR